MSSNSQKLTNPCDPEIVLVQNARTCLDRLIACMKRDLKDIEDVAYAVELFKTLNRQERKAISVIVLETVCRSMSDLLTSKKSVN